MRKLLVISFLLLLCSGKDVVAQRSWSYKKKFGTEKNTVYFYWGYNREVYTKSNINFWGPQYNFTLFHAKAHDRPSGRIGTYFNPSTISVPQFNVRIGWYYKEHWDWSVGYDHMKYVMTNNQYVVINGVIEGTTSSSLSGTYTDSDGAIQIKDHDLHYENTNGLNYISAQLTNTGTFFKTKNLKFAIQRRIGAGAGPVVTQTDFNWDGTTYHSTQKISGYGMSIHAGVRFDFFRHFFLMSNWSTGFIHMPKNPTVQHQGQYAKQVFSYARWDLLGGFLFYIRTKNACDTCPDWH